LHAHSCSLRGEGALYFDVNASAKEIVMNNPGDSGGPLRHFRAGRRAVLQSLTGVGAAVFASRASASHMHGAAAVATQAEVPETGLAFLDQHAFDTLATLSEQIVPGSRTTQVPEFLDRLLAVESLETQQQFMQSLGAFERAAREAHGTPWKSLTAEQANALLTKISTQEHSDGTRQAFDRIKGAVAETYFQTEAGMKELGWDGSMTFAPPSVCG
jgi:hypothetical protein